MDRREFVTAGAAGTAALMLSSGCANARPVAAVSSSSPRGVEKGLKGDFLDLTSPRGNRDAIARIMGDVDLQSTKFGWYSGIVQGVRPGEGVRDLFGFTGFSCAKLLPSLEGKDPGFRKVLREVGYYTDLQTGEIMDTWFNPYLEEEVPVVHIANDPFNFELTDYVPLPPSYGGLNDAAPPKIPLQLDWSRKGNVLNMAQRINLFYPAALQPSSWPRESGSPFNQVTEMFMYQIDWSEMQNQENTTVKTNGTWSRITPWLPWMLMGPTDGHINYSCFMGSGDTLNLADPVAVEYARVNHPKFLEAPEVWEDPSLSSLEWFAREQKAAPLPADGQIPFAPRLDPKLPF
ncbi:MAG: DUF1838 family protein [Erythrobacter sp.]|uniref:DUF1838 family protein n=1 Tax=Erythrobacter sp. TaxID=1042 RepID=UPI003262F861